MVSCKTGSLKQRYEYEVVGLVTSYFLFLFLFLSSTLHGSALCRYRWVLRPWSMTIRCYHFFIICFIQARTLSQCRQPCHLEPRLLLRYKVNFILFPIYTVLTIPKLPVQQQ